MMWCRVTSYHPTSSLSTVKNHHGTASSSSSDIGIRNALLLSYWEIRNYKPYLYDEIRFRLRIVVQGGGGPRSAAVWNIPAIRIGVARGPHHHSTRVMLHRVLALLWALTMLLIPSLGFFLPLHIDSTPSISLPKHRPSLFTARRHQVARPLRAVDVFDSSSSAETAKLVVVNLIGLGLYVLLQLIAPKLGLVDETKAKEGYKDGEEPWNLWRSSQQVLTHVCVTYSRYGIRNPAFKKLTIEN